MGVRAPNRSVVSIKTNSTRLLRPAPHSTPPEEAVGLEHLRWVQRRSHPRDRKPYDTTGIVHGELTRGAEPIGDRSTDGSPDEAGWRTGPRNWLTREVTLEEQPRDFGMLAVG